MVMAMRATGSTDRQYRGTHSAAGNRRTLAGLLAVLGEVGGLGGVPPGPERVTRAPRSADPNLNALRNSCHRMHLWARFD